MSRQACGETEALRPLLRADFGKIGELLFECWPGSDLPRAPQPLVETVILINPASRRNAA